MNQKIINFSGCKTCNQVLLFIDMDDNGTPLVKMHAWHEDGSNLTLQYAEIRPSGTEDDISASRRIVADFSEASALDFVNSFNV